MQTTGERRGETNPHARRAGRRSATKSAECGRGARALDTRQPAQIREEEAADFRPADLGLGFPPPESGAGDRPPPPRLTQAASRSPRGSARCRLPGGKNYSFSTLPKRAHHGCFYMAISFGDRGMEWRGEESNLGGGTPFALVHLQLPVQSSSSLQCF